MNQMVDPYGREIDYLRLSITPWCNLRCFYCTPPAGCSPERRGDLLSFDAVMRITCAAAAAGITKIRFTGGEPLVRKDFIRLCEQTAAIDGLRELAATTNGTFLEEQAYDLAAAGLKRINVSLDTLKRDRFRWITGQDLLPRVLAGIETAAAAGLNPIKINTVVMRGINDDEIEDLARMTLERPLQVRFIELMPTAGWTPSEYKQRYLPMETVVDRVKRIAPLRLEPTTGFGPARMCALEGAAGKIGFITPVSRHFCRSCNRLRVTADGKIRNCLFAAREFDLNSSIGDGAPLSQIGDLFRLAVAQKPRGHRIDQADHQLKGDRLMRAIGG